MEGFDLRLPGVFRRWAENHLVSIFNLARDSYDLQALDELILVTGYDAAEEYAMAVSMDRTTKGTIKFQVGIPDLAEGSATAWGTWIALPSVVTNSGPQLRRYSVPNLEPPSSGPIDDVAPIRCREHNATLKAGRASLTVGVKKITDPTSSNHASREEDAPLNDTHVHALFIRGYRMRKRSFFLGMKIKAAAGYHDPGAAGRDARDDTELVAERTPEGSMVSRHTSHLI